MRTFIMGLLLAGGIVFLLVPVRTVRMNFSEGPGRFNVVETPRVVRTTSPVRSVQRGTPDKSFQELKVEGQPRANRDDAFEDALKRAAQAIEDHYCLRTSLHPEDVKQLVRDPKEKNVPLGENLGEAKQFELTLQMDDDFVEKLATIERESRMTQRMHILARSLAVLVAGLFAIAGYVRLDEWSKGYYSGLLKAVAFMAVVGIGVAVWMK